MGRFYTLALGTVPLQASYFIPRNAIFDAAPCLAYAVKNEQEKRLKNKKICLKISVQIFYITSPGSSFLYALL